MRIISKFRDYYDGAGYFDPTITYVRNTTEYRLVSLEDRRRGEIGTDPTKDKNLLGPFSRAAEFWLRMQRREVVITGLTYRAAYVYEHGLDLVWVCLCGMAYPVYRLGRGLTVRNEPVLEYLNSYKSKYPTDELRACIQVLRPIEIPVEAHFDVQAPAFLVDWSYPYRMPVEANPVLRDHAMPKIIPPDECHRKIAFFLTNEMAQEKDIPCKVSDETRIQKHGFSKKTSFRNMPRD